MTPTAILILLCAASIHAGWNLLGKRRNPSPALFLLANTAGGLALAPFVLPLCGASLLASFHGPLAALIIGAGVLHVLYFVGLSNAYASGNLTVAYPLARSAAILWVALLNFALGRGHQVSGLCLAGIVLIVVGCMLLPQRAFGDLRWRTYANPCCLYALQASVGTALYTLVDDRGIHYLLASPGAAFTPLTAGYAYEFIEAISASLFLGLFVAWRSKSRAELRGAWKEQRGQAWMMGIGIYGAYGLVLASFAYVRNVSYASAFREVSILIGVLIGWLFLHERMYPPRAVGALLAFAGLILVGIG